MNNIKLMRGYLKYFLQETSFCLNLLWYVFIHPSHVPQIIKYSKRTPGITLENKIPWLTFLSINWLEKNLNHNMEIFEWGSGGSTFFLASRVKKIDSIEHDAEWYKRVSKEINNEKIINCEYHLVPKEEENILNKTMYDEYYKFIQKYPENHFDLILIDGIKRNECIYEAKAKIKPGGFIVLDNSERKEYELGINYLHNWKRIDFYGPGPYNHYFSKTTVFIKPKAN